MSKSYNSLREDLLRNADDKEYRRGFAEESLNLTIGTQIKVLREQRKWTQPELAQKADMNQSMISRYENVNYSSWTINTLERLAAAFDVVLDVRFRSFGELAETTQQFSREALQVPGFLEDPYFQKREALDEVQSKYSVVRALFKPHDRQKEFSKIFGSEKFGGPSALAATGIALTSTTTTDVDTIGTTIPGFAEGPLGTKRDAKLLDKHETGEIAA